MISALFLISSMQFLPVNSDNNWFISNIKTHTCVPLSVLGVKSPNEFAQALEKSGSKVSIKYHNQANGSTEATLTIIGNVGVGTSRIYSDVEDCKANIDSDE